MTAGRPTVAQAGPQFFGPQQDPAIIECLSEVTKQLSRGPGMGKNNLADLHPRTLYSTLIANKWHEVEHH
jgi:hypothetical protein